MKRGKAKTEMTARERQAFLFIEAYIVDNHIAPTVREIMRAIGSSSTSHTSWLVDALVRKGFLCRHEATARGIYLPPETVTFVTEDGDDDG